MKYFIFSVTVFVLGVVLLATEPALKEPVQAGNKLCPVSGQAVNPDSSVEVRGRVFGLCCNGCAESLKKEPEKYLGNFRYEKDGVTFVTFEGLKKLISEKKAVVIDVLSEESFQKDHIESAVNIPLGKIENDAEKIIPDKSKTVVTYCSGYLCSASVSAAKKLKSLGYQDVLDYKGGLSEWQTFHTENSASEKKKTKCNSCCGG